MFPMGEGWQQKPALGSPHCSGSHPPASLNVVCREQGGHRLWVQTPFLKPQCSFVPSPLCSWAGHRGLRYSRLLEAPHAVQNVELLPPFGKIHLPVNIVWVSQVNKGEVLQDEAPGRTEKPSYCSGQHVWPVLVSSRVNS